MARYPHTISLNEEQENKLNRALTDCELSLPDILMLAVEELLKNKN